MNYSTLPANYSNNMAAQGQGQDQDRTGDRLDCGNSPRPNNTSYGTITKTGQRHNHMNLMMNNYDVNPANFTPPPAYEEEDHEWSYPNNHHARQFILANNIQNSKSPVPPPVPDRNIVGVSNAHAHGHGHGHNDLYMGHPMSNNISGPLYIQNNMSGTSSPVPSNYGRTSPYITIGSNHGSLNRSTPVHMNHHAHHHPHHQQQQHHIHNIPALNPNNVSAAVVKQLQEKFSSGGGGEINTSASPVSFGGNQIQSPIPISIQNQHLHSNLDSPASNIEPPQSPPPQHHQHHQQQQQHHRSNQSQQQQETSLQRRILRNNGNNIRVSLGNSNQMHAQQNMHLEQQQQQQMYNSSQHPPHSQQIQLQNGGFPPNLEDTVRGDATTIPIPIITNSAVNNKDTIPVTMPSHLDEVGGGRNLNCGNGPRRTPERDCGSGGGSGGGGVLEENQDNNFFKSALTQCRLPVLLLIVVILLIIFILFSGALIYFNYLPYKLGGSLLEDEPCEDLSCAFGSSCVLDESGRGVCRCPENCSPVYNPVCGSDDRTYSNECLLQKRACQTQHSIRVRHIGQCDMPDPCADKACLYGSRCVASADGHTATCECPSSCPNYGDSDDSQPVCGSDGKYYRNRCELDRESCRIERNITVKFYGKCDPCEEVSCPVPQICQLDDDRRAECRCGEMCTMDFNPVCGSDGKTYSNECVMRQEACRTRRDLRVIYRGKCSSGTNPCESRTCRGYESCAINKFGIAQCTCAMKCDPVISPVCGSDRKTYDSHCELTYSSCRDARQITVAYRGTCENGSACVKHPCPPGATCSEKNGEATCECPVCPSDYDPVCGSDGVSYQNECRLKMEACLTNNNNIHTLYRGLCNLIRDFNPYDGCDRKQCDFYSICISEGSEAKCMCPENCTKDQYQLTMSPVCGTDGVTYSTECDLRKTACHLQKFVVVASKGHCDLCANVQCKFGAECENGTCVCPTNCPGKKEPVCGSNLMTYANECELQKTACKLSRSLTVHFYGDCTEGLNPPTPFGGSSGGSGGSGNVFSPSSSSSSSVSSSSSSAGTGTGPGAGTGTGTGSVMGPVPGFGFGSVGTITGGDSVGSSGSSVGGGGGFGGKDGEGPKLCESIRCDFGAMCELGEDGFPRCTCQFNCSATTGNPVCGSDLKLYANECEMRREACHRQTELRPRPMELCEETEVRPCNGEDPLRHGETGEDINCGNGPTRTNCPGGSYCHRSSTFAKCCKKPEERTTTRKPVRKPEPRCEDGLHGCCPDGVTSAMGEDSAGCPSVCQCNKLGSIAETCDPFTQECQCRPGVGTPKCDRCLPGFWGLSRIVVEGHLGCRECGCSKFGSVRDDCEQMTGRCVCKPGVLGHKCDSCAEGEFLGPYGCTSDPINLGRTCKDIACSFGAECEQDGNRAGCVCSFHCSDHSDASEEVCASDGFSYESDCMVRLQACRSQKSIWVAHRGQCMDSGESDGTESPVRRWTGLHYTEPGDEGGDVMGRSESARSNSEIWTDQIGTGFSSSGMKSTRHLPPQTNANPKYYETPFHKNLYVHRSPTQATIQIKSYLGDVCQVSTDCISAHSMCLSGWCICREGYYEDSERVQCKEIHSHLSGVLSCSKDPGLCISPTECVDHRNGTYSCLCPLGKTGPSQGCTQTEKPYPFFSGRSRIRLGKLAGYHKLSLELEITPYLNYAHGILIFSSQHANGSGDFLSLALIDGYVEFRYDLGDGAAILRSMNRVLSGTTYHIVAKRYNRDGLLRVDGDEEVKGTSPGSMKSLNLGDHGSFMGYTPVNRTKIWEVVGTSEGYIGCVHKLKVGRRPIDFIVSSEKKDSLVSWLSDVFQCPVMSQTASRLSTTPMYSAFELDEDSFGEPHPHPGPGFGGGRMLTEIYGNDTDNKRGDSDKENGNGNGNENEDYDTLKNRLCSSRNPCHNHGQCWTDRGALSGYKCVCHPEFTGKHCETRTSNLGETGAMLDFRGFSHLELPKIENGGKQVTIELWLMIRSRSGIILYNGQEMNKGDFIALLMTNGHLQFWFDLGSGVANITWAHPIALNRWHWIVASREGREGKLQVDGKYPQTVTSPPTLSELNLELPLYFGGCGESKIVTRELGGIKQFDGALQYIRINGETYHREITEALRERIVHKYEGPPCGSSVSPPCDNGGVCLPRLDSFVCLCPAQFSGKSCEGRKEAPGPIRFDGQNYLMFPRKIAKHESFNITDYDDFYNDHFDSQLDELFGEAEISSDGNGKIKHEDADFIDVDDSDEFVPLLEDDLEERAKAQLRNRIEVVFRTRSEASGLIIWTSLSAHSSTKHISESTRRGYLGLFLVDGFPELRIDLDAAKKKKPVIIRSKVKVNDNRWHQILIARRRKSIVVQVDGSVLRRATASSDSSVLVTDGRYWIGGVAGSVLPAEVPPSYHQGFVGCVDLVRIEKRRLPLTKIAYATGIPFCEDET